MNYCLSDNKSNSEMGEGCRTFEFPYIGTLTIAITLQYVGLAVNTRLVWSIYRHYVIYVCTPATNRTASESV